MSSRLVFELDVAPQDICPSRSIDYAGRLVGAFTVTPLFSYPEWGQGVLPGLIAEAECLQGGLEWIFHCGRDNTWSSGRRLDAIDIARALERREQNVFRPSDAFLFDTVASTEIIDPYTVRVTLRRPIACLPEILSADAFGVFPADTDSAETTGPYSLAACESGRVIGLSRNAVGKRVWPDGPDTLFFTVTASPEQGIRLFAQSVLDVTCNPNLPMANWDDYQASPSLRTRSMALAGVLIIHAPLCRKTISTAIGREAIAARLRRSVLPLHDLMDLFGTDPGAAAPAIPGEARFPPVRQDRIITLAYADFEPNGTVAAMIAADLADALGLQVQTRALDYASYLDELEHPSVDIVYTLIHPALPEPSMFLDCLRTLCRRGAPPDSRDRVNVIAAMGDYSERVEACRGTLRQWEDDLPVVPVVRHVSKCLVSEKASVLRLGLDGLFRIPHT